MKINKKSWHYKLYEWTYSAMNEARYLPCTTNLCQYVRQLTAGVFFTIVYLLLIRGFVFGIVSAGAFLFGYKSNKSFDFIKYDGVSAFEQELYPIHAIGLIVLGLCQWWLISHCGWELPLGIELAVLFAVLVGYVLIRANKPSDSGELFSEWLAAKKQGVCPFIEFEDDKSE